MQGLSGLQLQLLGVGIEIGLKVWNGHTVGVCIVDTQSATHVDMLYTDAMADKLLLQLVDAITECLEVAHIENLRSDVEVQTHELDVLKFLGLANHGYHIAHGDAELILGQTRGDVGMRMSTHIGVQTEGHTGHLALLDCEFVDHLEFGYALNVEAEDVVVKSEIDFPIALAHTSVDNLIRGDSGFYRSLNLTATYAVGSKTGLADDAKYTRVGISLYSIMHHETLVLASLVVNRLQRTA